MVITSDDVDDDDDDEEEDHHYTSLRCHVCQQEIEAVGLKVRINDKVVYAHKECVLKMGGKST